MTKLKQKTAVVVENSAEFKKMVDESIAEMDTLTQVALKAGMDPAKAKEKVASIYLRNMQQADDVVACAKKNVAELMTRIQLDRAINPDTELVGDKYVKLFKLQNEALKLIKDLEPKQINHRVQVDDDKMVFPITEGVYEEQ